MKWEYQLIQLQRKGILNVNWPTDDIDTAGDEGWEAVGIVQSQSDSVHNSQQFTVLMKRPKK